MYKIHYLLDQYYDVREIFLALYRWDDEVLHERQKKSEVRNLEIYF